MKIIYIANARIPTQKAHGYQIVKMCESFANHNHVVDLILPTRKNGDFESASAYTYYGVKNNFSITRLSTLDPVHLMRFPFGIYIKFQSLFFVFSVQRYLKQQVLDSTIIYTRDIQLVPFLIKKSKAVVWEAHAIPKHLHFYKKLLQRIKIISITQSIKDELVRMGIKSTNIFVAHDGVELNDFQNVLTQSEAREQLNLPKDKKIVLYTGHLYPWKGVDVLAQAAYKLSKGTRVIFVGGTNVDINRFTKKYSDCEVVSILGFKHRKTIPMYLAAADVLVLPNSGRYVISRYYTSPLKLFEYMAAGKPIIASDLPSIREVLDERTALFFQPDSPEKLSNTITVVLNSLKKFQQLGFNAKEKVTLYSWKNRAKKILDFIKIDRDRN